MNKFKTKGLPYFNTLTFDILRMINENLHECKEAPKLFSLFKERKYYLKIPMRFFRWVI